MLKPLLHSSLKPWTYYKIGGPAERLWIPRSVSELKGLVRKLQRWTLLGRGSNVLIHDEGLKGDVIVTRECRGEITVFEDVLCVPGSQSLVQLLSLASRENWGGLECLAGIPGSVGGAIAMNAGTHLGSIGMLTEWVHILREDQVLRLSKEDILFSYRSQNFLRPQQGDIVLEAGLRCKMDTKHAKESIKEVLRRRKETQPLEYPSCGSVFKNPSPEKKAWQVIESLHLRGFRIGDAQFSEKHPNFIVNLGAAKASDVRALIQLAETRAKAELGITLQPEVQCLGFDP